MYQIKSEQIIDCSLEEAWSFFSSPKNLSRITPSLMDFKIKTDLINDMYEGMIIKYTVRPLLNIPMTWVTEISHIKENSFFVDEQRIGPYKMWHHEHHFYPHEKGVRMVDIVSYALPFGIIGKIAHCMFVRKKLEGIFQFREEAVIKIFPSKSAR